MSDLVSDIIKLNDTLIYYLHMHQVQHHSLLHDLYRDQHFKVSISSTFIFIVLIAVIPEVTDLYILLSLAYS